MEGGSQFYFRHSRSADFIFLEGAARLHEFIIKVYHPDPEHASKISLHLRVKWANPLSVQRNSHVFFLRFPKTYPNLAGPIFTLEKPIKGLSDAQVNKLSHEVNLEVQKLRGSEMVFTVRVEPCIHLSVVLIPDLRLWPFAKIGFLAT